MKHKEWIQSKELVGLKGMPSTIQGINKKARREEWEKRRVHGVAGNIYEYSISSMPLKVQQSLEDVTSNNIINEQTIAENKSNYISTMRLPKNAITVLQYDLSASAGHGAYALVENPIASFTFSPEWLIEQNLYNKQLAIIQVTGDSMEPTLMNKDIILVSFINSPEEAREGVYVLRYDNEIFVKRIQFNRKDRSYTIYSDNDYYKEYIIEESEILSGRFSVVARVERVLQRLVKQKI